jgi:hypothetical protein
MLSFDAAHRMLLTTENKQAHIFTNHTALYAVTLDADTIQPPSGLAFLGKSGLWTLTVTGVLPAVTRASPQPHKSQQNSLCLKKNWNDVSTVVRPSTRRPHLLVTTKDFTDSTFCRTCSHPPPLLHTGTATGGGSASRDVIVPSHLPAPNWHRGNLLLMECNKYLASSLDL